MQSIEKRFYLKKNMRLMSWTQLAAILGFVVLAIVVWSLVLVFSDDTTIRLGLAFLTVVVMLALLPSLLLNISHLVSRLKISEQGLDYVFWPYYHIRCSWDEVQSITRRKEMMVEADIILLKSATEIGLPIAMAFRKRVGMGNQYFISLNLWDGWPSGDLAEILRHYSPRLFEKETISTSP